MPTADELNLERGHVTRIGLNVYVMRGEARIHHAIPDIGPHVEVLHRNPDGSTRVRYWVKY